MKVFKLKRTFAAVILVGGAMTAFAQQMPPIPTDPNVRIGKLENGLTYYIRHNELPDNQADFYIAQKVGSILEEDNQRGLAHFLEHMCFNGTTHFPDNLLREYLESIGVKFGANLNAYTSVDETVYNISNVPVRLLSVDFARLGQRPDARSERNRQGTWCYPRRMAYTHGSHDAYV